VCQYGGFLWMSDTRRELPVGRVHMAWWVEPGAMRCQFWNGGGGVRPVDPNQIPWI